MSSAKFVPCVYDLPQIMSKSKIKRKKRRKIAFAIVNGRQNKRKEENNGMSHLFRLQYSTNTHTHTKWSWIRLMFDNINALSGRHMYFSVILVTAAFAFAAAHLLFSFLSLCCNFCVRYFFRWRLMVSCAFHRSLKRCTKL